MAKAGSIRAGTLRSRSLEERAAIVAAVRENVWPLVEDGTVRPVIDTVFDLADASTAHELMESSEHIGKILLRVEAETGTGLP
jgi:NADPH:quinone reductase-like Zn-dependent oxidoreductase